MPSTIRGKSYELRILTHRKCQFYFPFESILYLDETPFIRNFIEFVHPCLYEVLSEKLYLNLCYINCSDKWSFVASCVSSLRFLTASYRNGM